mgnify:CR=1 FL=1
MTQQRRILLTVAALLAFIAVIVAGFVHRITLPRVMTVGRLDLNSEGLLLLTNDGKWSRQLTLPDEEHAKVYLVETAEDIAAETAETFSKGIYFGYEDLTTGPAELELLGERRARLTIYEGKYHQVKRMFHAVGNRVVSLHREKVGPIALDAGAATTSARQVAPNRD